MPFAKKFRAMMDMPLAGDTLGEFTVESVDARDVHESIAGHGYAVQMVLRGPGGKQAVQCALRSLFARCPTTFSGYGNPYQLWFGKPEIESLGDRRYAVSVKGYGARVYLAPDLLRFLRYLEDSKPLAASDPAAQEALVEGYLEQYRAEIRLLVARYESKRKRCKEMRDVPAPEG